MDTKAEMVATEEQTFIEQAGEAFSKLVKGVHGFLTDAKALEQGAEATWLASKSMTVPTTAAEDEAVQLFIKQANRGKQTIEAHWSICSTVHQLHRRLTARRDKGVKLLEDASKSANDLHNGYVAAVKLAAVLEQNRLRAEAEESARRVRQAELDRLEALALATEDGQDALSDREMVFVEAIVGGALSWTAAASKAGYKDPEGQGKRLMKTEKIAVAIKARYEALELRRQAAAVKAEPLAVNVVSVVPNITKAAGTSERTTWTADLFDSGALIQAIIRGDAPSDLLMIDQSCLNGYARSMHKLIDRWPGVRAISTTKVV